MKISKKQTLIAGMLLLFVIAVFSGCVPKEEKEKNKFFSKQSHEILDILKTKIKDGTIKDTLPPDIEKALAERIRTGKLEDFMPPTAVIIGGLMVPIISILAFIAFLIILVRLYHIRIMAKMEKGEANGWKPLNIKWEFVFLFFGVVLSFLGPAISIFSVSTFGLSSWSLTTGIIPLFIGIALLVFYRLYLKAK